MVVRSLGVGRDGETEYRALCGGLLLLETGLHPSLRDRDAVGERVSILFFVKVAAVAAVSFTVSTVFLAVKESCRHRRAGGLDDVLVFLNGEEELSTRIVAGAGDS
jgi:hypothetical protein